MVIWFLMILSALSGFVVVQQLPSLVALTNLLWAFGLCLVSGLYITFFSTWRAELRQPLVLLMSCLLLFLMSFTYATWRAETRLADALAPQHDNQVSKLVVEVSDLVNYGDSYLQFAARVLSARPASGIPKQVYLRWSFGAFSGPYQQRPPLQEPMPEIKPGEIWEFSVLLRKPYAAFNPGQGDMLSYRFANNQRAIGTIKGQGKRLAEQGDWRWSIEVARWRHELRKTMNRYLVDKRYGAVMIALVMGDQAAISQEDWRLFNRAGLTHLVSISGTHITMLSSLAALLSLMLLRRCSLATKLLAERVAAQRLAAIVALFVAFLYCQVAGWDVPAQRSFFMLLIFFVNWLFALQWSIQMVLSLAALFILVLDPWALMSIGFWLSFAAMLLLVTLLKEVAKGQNLKQRLQFAIRSWLRAQLAVFVGLAPLLALLFNQISLISPIANAYAIFIIGTVITPASLLLAFTSQFDALAFINQALADAVHFLLYLTLTLSAKLAAWPYALLDVSMLSKAAVVFASMAFLLLLKVGLSKWTVLAMLSFVPIVSGSGSTKELLKAGEWQAHVLDIGQGSAVLISTENKHWLFDLGPRTSYEHEASNRITIPVLRALGIKHLDYVVVSHSDLDHVGGFSELISQVSVGHVFASFRVDQWLNQEEQVFAKDYSPLNSALKAEACYAGQQFEHDGVRFSFIWPEPLDILPLSAKSANAESCVLLVEGRYHKLLLTGDIDSRVENKLLVAQRLPPVDVMVVAHHGSKTSSSKAFVEHSQATIAIAQAGHYNRYHHPDPQVVRQWQQAGSLFYSTIDSGAIRVQSRALGLLHQAEKEQRKRYWH